MAAGVDISHRDQAADDWHPKGSSLAGSVFYRWHFFTTPAEPGQAREDFAFEDVESLGLSCPMFCV
jgi:hypothetical protein